MNAMIPTQFDLYNLDDKQKDIPDDKSIPSSPSEQVVKKGIDTLNQNILEIKKIREEIERKEKNNQ